MIGTNRDLIAMREAVDYEILKLTSLKGAAGRREEIDYIDRQLCALSRERVALCAAIVNRRLEAAKEVVGLARWVSGGGALDNAALVRGAGRVNAQRFASGMRVEAYMER